VASVIEVLQIVPELDEQFARKTVAHGPIIFATGAGYRGIVIPDFSCGGERFRFYFARDPAYSVITIGREVRLVLGTRGEGLAFCTLRPVVRLGSPVTQRIMSSSFIWGMPWLNRRP
jgi:hypothetical protein